jgi:hypothetical protein
MNYQRIYNQLVSKVKSENRKKSRDVYYERHHIIPKCMGGTNDKENLVLLTAREHFIAHKLLHFIDPEHSGLSMAYYMMATIKDKKQKRDIHIGSYEYERLKILKSETHSKIMKGRIVSEKTRHLISQSQKGEKNSMYNKKHTPEAIQKIREANIGEKNSFYGKAHTPETIRKLREINLVKIVSEKTRQKIREANMGKLSPLKGIPKTKVTCPHCSKQCDPGNAAKYHFDNCKFI